MRSPSPPPATRPSCACTTCVSSWASSSRPASLVGSNAPGAKKMSAPIVNARARIVRAAVPATASVWTRTRERSAWSTASISRRSVAGSASPPPRRARAAAMGGPCTASSSTGASPLRWSVAAGNRSAPGAWNVARSGTRSSPRLPLASSQSTSRVPGRVAPARKWTWPSLVTCFVAPVAAGPSVAILTRVRSTPNIWLMRDAPEISSTSGRSGSANDNSASALATTAAPGSPDLVAVTTGAGWAAGSRCVAAGHRLVSAATWVRRPGVRMANSLTDGCGATPSSSTPTRVSRPTSGRSRAPRAARLAAT